MRRRLAVQRERLGGIDPAAGEHLVRKLLNHLQSASSVCSIAPRRARCAISTAYTSLSAVDPADMPGPRLDTAADPAYRFRRAGPPRADLPFRSRRRRTCRWPQKNSRTRRCGASPISAA
jgi:hypothetical protein